MATEGPCPSSEEAKGVRTSGVQREAKQPIVRTWFRHYSLSRDGIYMDHNPGTTCCTLDYAACRTDTICHHLSGSTSTSPSLIPVDSLQPLGKHPRVTCPIGRTSSKFKPGKGKQLSIHLYKPHWSQMFVMFPCQQQSLADSPLIMCSSCQCASMPCKLPSLSWSRTQVRTSPKLGTCSGVQQHPLGLG